MLKGDIAAFGWVGVEVVEFGVDANLLVGTRFTVAAWGVAGEAVGLVGKKQFPGATAKALEFVLVVVERVGWVGVLGAGLMGEQGPDIAAVDGMLGQGPADATCDRGEQIDGHERGFGDGLGGDMAGPPHDARHAHAAFENGPFAFAKPPGGAGVVAVVMPGTVIGEEYHPSILGEAKSVEGLKHATDGVVDFFDDIPIEPLFGMPFEVITDVEGDVGHVVG